MKRSTNRILTTHAGSLPRPKDLIELYHSEDAGKLKDRKPLSSRCTSAVAEVLAQQKQAGVDIPDDGEFGKSTGQTTDYAPWLTYIYPRLKGFTGGVSMSEAMHFKAGGITFGSFHERRDFGKFREFYQDPQAIGFGGSITARKIPACTEPISYAGQEALQADISNLKAAMAAAGVAEAFMCSASPGVIERSQNRYYQREEDFLSAIADAMHQEYKAIVEAGMILQIDDPGMPDTWDAAVPEPPLELYKKYARVRVEALNHALRGLPEERVRYHICWGSWHGPHTTDIALRDVVDLVLSVHAGAYSVEAGNVRHEHEWTVWQDVKLPPGKILIPGVVSHATNVVEHPELVAERIVRFANLVGRENVIAGTDCGLGGRLHPSIAWAKLAMLAEGAALASKKLWR
ncbi:MAG TPA: cobalamin-independent methionine synthase II family protein [Candidatus Binataceae bacterium]|nr:cobalamin-independent methionine synthase II family protein [Candidatus Binataceae bacterium]